MNINDTCFSRCTTSTRVGYKLEHTDYEKGGFNTLEFIVNHYDRLTGFSGFTNKDNICQNLNGEVIRIISLTEAKRILKLKQL